jgi:phage terminase large subunit
MIAYISARGWNAHPCTKGKGSVADGISFVKSKRLNVTRRSSNVLRELSGYRWITDRTGRVLEEPVDFDNHAMDAIRYGIVGAFSRGAEGVEHKSLGKKDFAGRGAW